MEAAPVASEAALAAAESSVRSPIESEAVFQGEVGQLARHVRELGDEADRMGQICDRKVEDLHFERDGLQLPLNSTASQLLRARDA